MNATELKKILNNHAIWLKNGAQGKKDDFKKKDLLKINLTGANLFNANLYGDPELNFYGILKKFIVEILELDPKKYGI